MEKRKLINRKFCLYKHTSPSNKVYIGITCNSPNRRWRNGYGYKNCTIFYNAIRKYGWDNFKHEILFSNLSLEVVANLEKAYIQYYKELNRSYNHSDGGTTNAGYTASTKQREHARNIWKGKHLPEDVKRKGALKRTGIKQSEETKIKRSLSMQNSLAKSLLKVDFNGTIVKKYNSLREAALDNNALNKQIAQCCNLGQLSFKGFYYMYEEEYKSFGISKRLFKPKLKSVLVFEEDNLIAEYVNAIEAGKALNMKAASIKRACTNFSRNNRLNKYRFLYKDNGTISRQKMEETELHDK